MNTLKLILKVLIILTSCFFLSCKEKNDQIEKTYTFKFQFFDSKTFPVYPSATPDFSYAKVGVYVFSQVYGWDPKNRIIYAYYVEDNIQKVKSFYENNFSLKFDCQIVNHEEFMRSHWDLFQEFNFPDFEGFYEHCSGYNMDLLSPVYHYGKLGWESGTMIVFHIERYL